MNTPFMWVTVALGLLVLLLLLRLGAVAAEQRRILSSILRAFEALPPREAGEEQKRLLQAGNALLTTATERLQGIEQALSVLSRPAPPPAPVMAPPPVVPASPLLQPLPPMPAPAPAAVGWVPAGRPAEAAGGSSLLDQLEEIRKQRLTQSAEGEGGEAPGEKPLPLP